MAAGSIIIDLLMKTGSFETSTKKASGSLQKFQKDAIELGKTAAKVGAAVAVAGAGIAVAWTKSVAETGKEIDRLSTLSNTSAEEFQKFAYASKTVGIEQEKLSDIFKDVQDRVGDFMTTGGGPMLDFFENIAPKIGVTADQFAKLSGPDALQLYYDSLEKAGVSQSEMIFYMEAMASDSALLSPLLADNGKKMGELGSEAERLGGIMSNQTVKAAKELDSNLNQLKTMLGGVSTSIANEVLPILNNFITGMIDSSTETDGLHTSVKDLAGNTALKIWIEGIARTLAVLAEAAIKAGQAIRAVAMSAAVVATDVGFAIGAIKLTKDSIFNPEKVDEIAAAWTRLKNHRDKVIGDAGQSWSDATNTDFKIWDLTNEAIEKSNAPKPFSDILRGMSKDLSWMLKPSESNTDNPNLPTGVGVGSRSSNDSSRSDAAADYIQQLNEQIALVGKVTEYEKALTHIQLGKYGDLSEYQQNEILARTQVLDMMKEQQALIDKIGDDPLSYIRGSVSPLSGGAFDDQVARYEAEAEAEEERYAAQLERLQEAQEAELLTTAEHQALLEEMQQAHQDRMDQIDTARETVQLAGQQELFGNMADLTKNWFGEQSGIYKAMFAVEKAYAIAKVLMNAPKTASDAYAAMASIPYVGPALGVAAAAAALTYQTAQAAGLSSVNLSGMAHDGIDSVPKTGTWLLEKGERVTTAETSARLDAVLSRIENQQYQPSGQQFNQQSGLTVNLIENQDRAGEVQERRNDDGSMTADLFVADIRGGGKQSRALESTYGLRRMGA